MTPAERENGSGLEKHPEWAVEAVPIKNEKCSAPGSLEALRLRLKPRIINNYG